MNSVAFLLEKYFLKGHFLQKLLCAHIALFISTTNWEIFLAKIFRRPPSTTEIKLVKYFLRRINGTSLCCRVVIVIKIKPGKNLTDEIFYRPKISRL